MPATVTTYFCSTQLGDYVWNPAERRSRCVVSKTKIGDIIRIGLTGGRVIEGRTFDLVTVETGEEG